MAPAGFGKTTLARQWLAPRRRGWYRGSPAAADVAALAVGLARSAGSIIPDAGRRMGERLRATGTPEKDVEPLAELLAEDLADGQRMRGSRSTTTSSRVSRPLPRSSWNACLRCAL